MAKVGKTHDIKLDSLYLRLRTDQENFYIKGSQQQYVERLALERGIQDLAKWTPRLHEDWSLGYDQVHLNRENSSPRRFYDSKGIDISEIGEVKLLHATAQSKASTNVVALPQVEFFNKLVMADGTDIFYWDGSAWSAAITTGFGSGNILSLETDGKYIYAVTGSNEIRRGDLSGNWAGGAWHTSATAAGFSKVKYCNLYLYALEIDGTNGDNVWEIDTSASPSETIITADLLGWVLTGLERHDSQLYFGGQSGDASRVWRYDGEVVSEAWSSPTGFQLSGLYAYLHVLLMYGKRVTATSGSGLGELWGIANNSPYFIANIGTETASRDYNIQCADGEGNDIFFGWNHETGLGKYSLSRGGVVKHVYNTLTAAAGNIVYDVKTFQNKKFFTVLGKGCYAEGATWLTSGWLQTSKDNCGLAVTKKYFKSCSVVHSPLAANQSIKDEYSIDEGAFAEAGTSDTDGEPRDGWALTNIKGYEIENKITLAGGGSDTPTLKSFLNQLLPIVDASQKVWRLVVDCSKDITLLRGGKDNFDWLSTIASHTDLIAAIDTLINTQSTYTLTDKDESTFTVMIDKNESREIGLSGKETGTFESAYVLTLFEVKEE